MLADFSTHTFQNDKIVYISRDHSKKRRRPVFEIKKTASILSSSLVHQQ